MQWLPAYQLSKNEFNIIAKTMLDVFPRVTVWRGDFSALKPIVGLVGHQSVKSLSGKAWMFQQDGNDEERVPLLAHYVGNLEAVRAQFSNIRINTDNQPFIEFLAPVSQRKKKSKEIDWLAGKQLLSFMQDVQEKSPYANDGYLKNLDNKYLGLPAAGLHLHKAQLLKQQGRLTAAEKEFEQFKQKKASYQYAE